MKKLLDGGVRLFYYQTGKEVRRDTALDKIMNTLDYFAKETEREQARLRGRESAKARAARGAVTGGILFGYANVRREGRNTVREIHPTEASIVRRVFEMSASGLGSHRVSRKLNGEGIPAPHCSITSGRRKRADGAWASSTVRWILQNPHYKGEIITGRSEWREIDGKTVKVKKPENEWHRRQDDTLAIVDADLWQRAQRRHNIGPTRPRKSEPSVLAGRNLLDNGMCLCGLCGSRLTIVQRKSKGNALAQRLVCGSYQRRGPHGCNGTRTWSQAAPYDALMGTVTEYLRDGLLSASNVSALAQDEIDRVARLPDERARRRDGLDTQARDLEKRIANLTRVLEADPNPDDIARRKALRADLDRVRQERAALDAEEKSSGPAWTRDRLMDLVDTIEHRLENLQTDPRVGRAMLRRFLAEPVTITPVEGGWRVQGSGTMDRVLRDQTMVNVDEAEALGEALDAILAATPT